jgi:hypothetical protein
MIVVRVRGGLGNQLFQYAAGLALADQHKTDLKLDLYYFKKHPYRKFALDKFRIPVMMASRKEVHVFTGSNPVIRYINKRENYFHCPRVFSQPHYHYYEDFFQLPAPLYLNGYWQSQKYFATVEKKVREIYQPQQLDTINLQLIEKLRAIESVSLHVRIGDYAAAAYNSFFGGLTSDYYQRAIHFVRQKTSSPVFFVFSDDIGWCKKNLPLENVTYIEHNRGDNSYNDLVLMSHCKHNIMANSSFSWWGAWLNENPSKIVVAPRDWFRQKYLENKNVIYPCRFYNVKDLIPSGWNLL